MIKKYGILYFLKYYNFLAHALFAVALYLSRNYVFTFFCTITQITERNQLFYKAYQLLVPVLLFAIWFMVFFTSIRSKLYKYKTGRSFGYDSSHYKRSYHELDARI